MIYYFVVKKELKSENETKALGERLGRLLRGSETIELVGDVGAGKTTFTKGLARGLDIDEAIQSPSFTISRVYDARNGLVLAHYDFYRLADAGIMNDELRETLHDPETITVIEWADIVEGVLPEDRIRLHFQATSEETRLVTVDGPAALLEKL